ncbi:MAG: IS1634 family transposase [Planctomycetes bacterium]|nr:IS1634 family transposase [Planctomycetota bacterium]
MTSTYFEGECKANPMARRGHSRDSRPDCLQVCIGLVVTRDGIPLGHEVFDGNTHDSTTVETLVKAMEKKYGRANRIWAMDRGMVSQDHLKFLRQRGGWYIVGPPKAMLRRFESAIGGMEKDWHEVQAGVEVKRVPGPDGEETFVLARSADRRKKEQAMHQRFLDRMEEALTKMRASIESGRLKDEAVAQRRLGRLQERYWRATAALEIKIAKRKPPKDERVQGRPSKNKARLSISWKRRQSWTDWVALAQWMRRAGLGDAPRTLIEEFAKIKSGDVVLPARMPTAVGVRSTCVA